MMFRCEGWALCKKRRVNSLDLRRRLLQIHQKQWLKNQPFVTGRNQARRLTANKEQNKTLYFWYEDWCICTRDDNAGQGGQHTRWTNYHKPQKCNAIYSLHTIWQTLPVYQVYSILLKLYLAKLKPEWKVSHKINQQEVILLPTNSGYCSL